jgi:hypothetical protein
MIHNATTTVGIAVASCGLGFALGVLCSRRIHVRELEEQIADVKAHYQHKSELRHPDDQGHEGESPMGDPDWDDGAEEADEDEVGSSSALVPSERDTTKPYIISLDEFSEEHNMDYQKLTLKYYEEDDVLADERDQPISNPKKLAGPHYATGFGIVGDDPNILYIRNDEIDVDFEIVLDKRSFMEVVYGYGNPKTELKKMKPEQ